MTVSNEWMIFYYVVIEIVIPPDKAEQL